MKSQLTRAAIWHLNITLKRIAERVERNNYERMLARVQDALNERDSA
jgi:hypothetical protein